MITLKTKILAFVLVLTLLGGIAVKSVSAQDSNPSFVQKLIDRFNLNQQEVDNFVDQEWQQRHQQMLEFKQQRLDQAVSDGVITQDQKQAIVEKWQQAVETGQQHRQQMQQWFADQGINHDALRPYLGGGFGHRGNGLGCGR